MVKLLKREMVLGVAVATFSGLSLILATPKRAAGFAACEFSVGPDYASCCDCDNHGKCEEVEENGVASCTFEFCSTTPCAVS